jgi:phosphoglycolate phosphatase-like HAD superfamily hydrolase
VGKILFDFDGTLAHRPGMWSQCLVDALDEVWPGKDIDLEATLTFGETLLADPSGCWNRLKWPQIPGFLHGFFPEGLSFENDAIGIT